jgi:hypothetical protein
VSCVLRVNTTVVAVHALVVDCVDAFVLSDCSAATVSTDACEVNLISVSKRGLCMTQCVDMTPHHVVTSLLVGTAATNTLEQVVECLFTHE